jgi:antirestriction protein ArdC
MRCPRSGGFGSALYAKEELIAEITSAFVIARIVPTVRRAGHVGSGLAVLRDDDLSANVQIGARRFNPGGGARG